MRDHFFAPGIFAEDVRWIARLAQRNRSEAGLCEADDEPPIHRIAPVVATGHDDMKPKSKSKRAAGAAGAKRRRRPGASAKRFKRPLPAWEVAVPAVPFRRDGPWELGAALE